jgi:2-dehydrotetronate isomerase
MPRFAANLSMMFTEVPFPARFEAAARAGFRYVEFLFPYEHPPQDIARWLGDNGLQNVLFNMPPGDWQGGERGMASIPGREGEFDAGVARALEYAEALGTPQLHAMAGLLPPGADRSRHREVYVRNLKRAARTLAGHERTLLLEAINPRDIPNFFVNHQADAHALRREIDEPNVKVQMDFYHAQIVDGDLTTIFKSYFDGIGHIQIAGVPGRHEPDVGEINYPFLFELIDSLGYEGWIGCEYRPRGTTLAGLGWAQRYGIRG